MSTEEANTLLSTCTVKHLSEDAIELTGEVCEEMYSKFLQIFVRKLVRRSEPLTVYINSPGGDVYHSLAIYDLLLRLGSTRSVRIIAAGMCMSGATLIMQAGHERIATANTAFMIHKGSETHEADSDVVYTTVAFSKKISKRMLEIYRGRTKVKRLGHDRYFTAQEALAIGLIDDIL